jgi:energy-coupling factor transporter ATP-binding protein EcfA2
MSLIYTFYSFKGGVGRSMALANIAELLYRRGLKVLLIDFDLEAPGLERFFETSWEGTDTDILEQRGIVDLLVSYKELRALHKATSADPTAEKPEAQYEDSIIDRTGSRQGATQTAESFPFPVEPFTNFVVPIHEHGPGNGALLFMPAGRRVAEELTRYSEKVGQLDWTDFYGNWNGEWFFEWFRKQASLISDVVLIDSRTGFTEMGGVCTYHLADTVVMFVAANTQNLEGIRIMAHSLRDEELITTGRKGRPLSLLFVPSRIEHSESDLLGDFADEFEKRLTPYMPKQIKFETSAFIDLKIPYIPRYAYIETVAVREPERTVAAEMISAYTRIASAMVEVAPRRSELYQRFKRGPAPEKAAPRRATALAPGGFVGRGWVIDRIDDWLGSPQGARLLLVTGEPGSGKSALVQHLYDISEGSTPSTTQNVGGAIGALHTCDPLDRSTLEPLIFIESLANQLAARYQAFAEALAVTTVVGVNIPVIQTIGSGGQGSQVVGVSIGPIAIGAIPVADAFTSVIRRPLEAMCSVAGFDESVLLVVDGLDAALSAGPSDGILSLLSHAFGPTGELPPQVRAMVTARPDPRIVAALGHTRVDLALGPEPAQDIRAYALVRVGGEDKAARESIVDKIVERSDGNFLYAKLVLDDLDLHPGVYREDLLPTSVGAAYSAVLRAQSEGSPDRWVTRDRPFFGVLAVAFDPGLTKEQCAGILGVGRLGVEELMQSWGQYVEGAAPGPQRLFHSSFREFLLSDATFQVDVFQSHKAIAEFLIRENSGFWNEADEYATRHVMDHLIGAIDAATERQSKREIAELVFATIADERYQAERTRRDGGDAWDQDLERTLPLLQLLNEAESAGPEAGRVLIQNYGMENYGPTMNSGDWAAPQAPPRSSRLARLPSQFFGVLAGILGALGAVGIAQGMLATPYELFAYGVGAVAIAAVGSIAVYVLVRLITAARRRVDR